MVGGMESGIEGLVGSAGSGSEKGSGSGRFCMGVAIYFWLVKGQEIFGGRERGIFVEEVRGFGCTRKSLSDDDGGVCFVGCGDLLPRFVFACGCDDGRPDRRDVCVFGVCYPYPWAWSHYLQL